MSISRRGFLKSAAAASAGLLVLPSRAFGAGERINIAFVGAGGKGWHAIKSLRQNRQINMAAFVDVDQDRASQAYKEHPNVPRFTDFRAMLDKLKDGVDAIIISTPDHTHHYIATQCMKAGKHVYVEKPLTHNIAEARDLMKLERATGLACQMGNQGHSGGGIVLMDAWLKSGVLGRVEEVHAWATPQWSFEDRRPPREPVPAGFDWDKWLGPAAEVPFNKSYIRGHWRGWFEFGGGTLGDWFCHNADAPYSALGLDCPKRVEIESTGAKKLSFPESAKITFAFDRPDGSGEIKLCWYQGKTFLPPRPRDMERGRQMGNDSGGTQVVCKNATIVTATHAAPPRIVPFKKYRAMQKSLPKPNLRRSSHWDNWLNAIKGKETCRSNFAYGGRLTETMQFGNIALHVNRNIRIDPKTREIVGDEDARAMMSWPTPRAGWL